MTTLTSTLHTTRDMAEIVTREPKNLVLFKVLGMHGRVIGAWQQWQQHHPSNFLVWSERETYIRYNTCSITTPLQRIQAIGNDEVHRIHTGRERACPPVQRKAIDALWLWGWGGGASLDLIFSLNPAPYRRNNPHFRMRQKSQGTALQNILTQKRFKDELFFKAWVYTASL